MGNAELEARWHLLVICWVREVYMRITLCCFSLFNCFLLIMAAGCGEDDVPRPEADVMPMVLIPAGEFLMGSRDEGTNLNSPPHSVYVDDFYMDVFEVTNAQYRRFVQATGYKEPYGYAPNITRESPKSADFMPWSDERFKGDDKPVVCISFRDAEAYCEWVGKRLPTEAEWEKAARGGMVGSRYIWGDSDIPPKGAGNFAGEEIVEAYPNWGWRIIQGYNDGYEFTAPVGSFDPNEYGLYDMSGNVQELCQEWYAAVFYKIPTPSGSETCEVRDGSWSDGSIYHSRVAYSYGMTGNMDFKGYTFLGFRCVSDTAQ